MSIKMKGPKGTNSATIEGHEYDVDDEGVITVSNETHIPVLKLHGFVEHASDDPADYDIDGLDKEELIAFIEERGGDADGMTKKQLRAAAYKLIEE